MCKGPTETMYQVNPDVAPPTYICRACFLFYYNQEATRETISEWDFRPVPPELQRQDLRVVLFGGE